MLGASRNTRTGGMGCAGIMELVNPRQESLCPSYANGREHSGKALRVLCFNALTIGCTMSKHAKPLSFSLPLVRVMVRKRAVQSKWGTHAGKVGRVFNAGKYMIAAFPKRSARCITANLRVS